MMLKNLRSCLIARELPKHKVGKKFTPFHVL